MVYPFGQVTELASLDFRASTLAEKKPCRHVHADVRFRKLTIGSTIPIQRSGCFAARQKSRGDLIKKFNPVEYRPAYGTHIQNAVPQLAARRNANGRRFIQEPLVAARNEWMHAKCGSFDRFDDTGTTLRMLCRPRTGAPGERTRGKGRDKAEWISKFTAKVASDDADAFEGPEGG